MLINIATNLVSKCPPEVLKHHMLSCRQSDCCGPEAPVATVTVQPLSHSENSGRDRTTEIRANIINKIIQSRTENLNLEDKI